jgi:hypothetical protein
MEEMSRRQRRLEGLSGGGQGLEGAAAPETKWNGVVNYNEPLPFMYCVEYLNQHGNFELENKDLPVLS